MADDILKNGGPRTTVVPDRTPQNTSASQQSQAYADAMASGQVKEGEDPAIIDRRPMEAARRAGRAVEASAKAVGEELFHRSDTAEKTAAGAQGVAQRAKRSGFSYPK